MKKKLCSILLGLMLVVSILGLVACGKSPVKNFNISFIVEGNTYATITTNGNEKISIPQNPTKDGFTFDGWFWDKDSWKEPFSIKSILDTPLTFDISIYAKFIENHTHSYTEEITQPTCTEKGYTTHTCSCGSSYVDTYVNALGHSFTHYISDNNATCLQNETETAKCDRCDETDTREIPNSKLGHEFTNYVSNNDATCLIDGTKTAHCNHNGCNETDKRTDVGSALGHQFTNYINDNNATCMSNGTETAKCNYCNETKTREVTNSKLGHSFTKYISNNNATSNSFATKTATCDRLGCNETQTVDDTIEFRLTSDNSFYIVSNATNYQSKKIYIPAVYNNLRVIAIGENAFNGNEYIETVDLPNSIERIDPSAFKDCSNLKQINFTNNITLIGDYSFSGCSSLESINLNDKIKTIGSYAFNDCSSLESINLKDELTTIGNFAFRGCSSLLNVILPNSVASFGVGVFKQANHLEEITLSTQLTSIPNVAFQGCSSLNKIEVLSGISSIGQSAFSDCSNLKEIKILGDLTTFGNSAFYLCESLETVIFNSSTNDNLSDNNYIFYNAGIKGQGIKFIVGENGYIPSGLFTPNTNENQPNIIELSVEEGATKVDYLNDGIVLPYLQKVTLPNTLTSLNSGFISACKNAINSQDGISYLDNWVVDYDNETPNIILKEGIISICKTTFQNKTVLKSLVIPDSVTSLSQGLFSGCSSLESITLPFVGGAKTATSASSSTLFGYIFGTSSYVGGVAKRQLYYYNEYYGESSASNKGETYYIPSSLKSVTITGGNILYGSFFGCNNLINVVIGDSVERIEYYAFYNCYKLIEVINKSKLNITAGSSGYGYVGYYAKQVLKQEPTTSNFIEQGDYIFYNSNGTYYLMGYKGTDTELVLPNDINGNNYSINQYAFYDCSSLTSVVIPNSVTSIGDYAFSGCSSLTSIEIPDSVTSIGDRAFYNCSSLTGVTIPDSVTSIDCYAFTNCSKLTSIVFNDTSTWYRTNSSFDFENKTGGTQTNVTYSSTNATYFKDTYRTYYWYKI